MIFAFLAIVVVVWVCLLPFQKWLTFWGQAILTAVISLVVAGVVVAVFSAAVG